MAGFWHPRCPHCGITPDALNHQSMTEAAHQLTLPPREAGGTPPAKQRLLLISYHFPPGSATGALRWQKLLDPAWERGWTFDVITAHPDELSRPDFARLQSLPRETRVFGVRRMHLNGTPSAERLIATAGVGRHSSTERRPIATGENGVEVTPEVVMREDVRWSLWRPLGWLRALRAAEYFREEGRWARQAEKVALQLARETSYAGVVTCGPPQMVHRAGRSVSLRANLPWAMDMRDPWSLVPGIYISEASPLWYRLAEQLESSCVEQASLIVTNTDAHRSALQHRYPQANDRIVSVLNGCDEDLLPRKREASRFTIVYAGNIYIDRDPRPFFSAVASFVRAQNVTPAEFGVEFIGNADRFAGASVMALAEAEGLGDYVRIFPPVPRAELLRFLEDAAMMLSLPQGADLAIPSKLFEYMQYDAWLLALARKGTATETLLSGSDADVVDPGDVAGITRILTRRFLGFRRGDRARRVNWDGRFDRRHQANKLLNALERRFGIPAREQAHP